MAHNTYDFTAGDTGSKIRVRMINALTGGLLVPFSGTYNAYIVVKPEGGGAVKRTMALLTGVNDGYAEYQFTSAELTVGTLQTQVEIQKVSDGTIVSELGVHDYSVGPKLA
jgi:ribosome-interacting GTPase 1